MTGDPAAGTTVDEWFDQSNREEVGYFLDEVPSPLQAVARGLVFSSVGTRITDLIQRHAERMAGACELYWALVRTLDLDHDGSFISARVLVRVGTDDRARALARACFRARVLVFDPRSIFRHLYEGKSNTRGAVGRALDRAVRCDDAGSIERIYDLALQYLADTPVEVRRAGVAHRLIDLTVRFLPAAKHAEYDELFRSELFDLAQGGCGRWALLRHALRVLVRAPQLRCALRGRGSPAKERSW